MYEFKDISGKTIRTGDTVEWFRSKYKVAALHASGNQPYDMATLKEIGSGRTIEKPTHELRLANSRSRNATNPVVRKALNSVATNAKDANGKEIKVGSLVRPKTFRPGMEEVVKSIEGDKVWYTSTYGNVWEYAKNLIVANARACNGKWVVLYRDGGKEKIDAPSHAEAKRIADEKSRKSGRGYISVIVDDGVDYGINAAAKWRQIKATANAVKTTNAVVAKALNSVRNSVFQTETELERAIGAKLGKSVDVGIDGNAVSIGLKSKGDVEKAVAVVKEKLGDVVSYKYMDGSDPWLQVTLKTSVPNAATKTYDPNRRPSVIVKEINRKCPKLSAKVDAWFVWVEFRDKKGVKGRLPDAIMAEPGFPRDKLEVADVRTDGVLFTVKGNPYVNAILKNAATKDAVAREALNAIGGVRRNSTITDPQRLDFAKSRVKYVARGEKYGGQGRTVNYFIDIKVPINKKEMAALDKEIKDFETESADYRSLIKMEPDNKDVYEKASVAAKKIADGDRELLASLRKGQTIESDGRFKLVYNPFNEGWSFYIGGNGESMRDMTGRPIVGASRKADAVATFERLVASANRAVGAKALNYSPYHKGRWLHDHKSGRNFTVVKEEHWGKDSRGKDSSPVECRCVTLRDSTTGRIVELPTTMVDYRFHLGEVEACDVCNSSSVRTRNAVVQKALNTVAANAKFAVTTKSGRSVVIEAPNYKAAEKEAKRRFGAGCIVNLVGNSVAAGKSVAKNANSNHNTSQTQGDEMASTNKVIRNAVAAYNYTMIGGRTKPVTRTDGDIEGELMLGWTEIKRRVDFGDESSEREYGQKLKDLFEGKRFAFMDRANARRLEDTLLREWNKLAEFNKLSSL